MFQVSSTEKNISDISDKWKSQAWMKLISEFVSDIQK